MHSVSKLPDPRTEMAHRSVQLGPRALLEFMPQASPRRAFTARCDAPDQLCGVNSLLVFLCMCCLRDGHCLTDRPGGFHKQGAGLPIGQPAPPQLGVRDG
jgi:hypothetical protein